MLEVHLVLMARMPSGSHVVTGFPDARSESGDAISTTNNTHMPSGSHVVTEFLDARLEPGDAQHPQAHHHGVARIEKVGAES